MVYIIHVRRQGEGGALREILLFFFFGLGEGGGKKISDIRNLEALLVNSQRLFCKKKVESTQVSPFLGKTEIL